jgi:hypothetical protein
VSDNDTDRDGIPIETGGVDDEDELVFLDDEEELAYVLAEVGVLPRKKGKAGLFIGIFLLLLLLGGGGFALWWFVLRDRPAPGPATGEPAGKPNALEREIVEETPRMLRQRRSSLRLSTALKHGGTEESENAVEAALDYLSRVARPTGGWDSRAHGSNENVDLALTGLGLLAYAGAGQTTARGNHTKTVREAVTFLVEHQNPETGLIWRKGQGGNGPGYTHAICSMALVEIAALDRDEELAQAAKKAVNYAGEIHQFRKGGKVYAWRYEPSKEWGDTSVTGWFVMLLKVAPQASIEVPRDSLDGAVAFLESVRTDEKDPEGRRYHMYGYMEKKNFTPRLSVMGCLSRLYTDTEARDLLPTLDAVMEKNMPVWSNQDWYYWYYGMLLTFQVDAERFSRWNLALRDHIVRGQVKDGEKAGSWDPGGDWGVYGRIFTTAMAALCLEVYYRYAPKEERGN